MGFWFFQEGCHFEGQVCIYSLTKHVFKDELIGDAEMCSFEFKLGFEFVEVTFEFFIVLS